MKYKKIVLIALTLLVLSSCQRKNYKRIDHGIIVEIQDSLVQKIRLKIYSDKIVRITAFPNQEMKDRESLCVIKQEENIKWSIIERKDDLILKTESLKVYITPATGQIIFKDKDDKEILKEIEFGGKSFHPVKLANETKYSIRQVFESPEDEAFYGLGQHQHGLMNYKGLDVELAQHNLVAVVPFLYSNKGYGILWDNYSITRFGDPREYLPINTLHLFNKEGKEGALSAEYIDFLSKKIIKQEESVIDYQFINAEGNMSDIVNGKEKVTWEGFISSEVEGRHKFQLYASEYFRLWIDDQLIMDKWRQGWNPWSNPFQLDMMKGRKYKIKLEWKPMGNAYISLKHLDPQKSEDQNRLSLYSEVADKIDYYFIKGDEADEVIKGYRQLTGKAPIMPKWAMGLWQSRERYMTQDQLLNIVKEYRKRQIPLDNIVLDWRYWEDPEWGSHEFDSLRFPDPQGMVKEVHDLHAHIMISVWPKFNTETEHFNEMNNKGYLYQYYLSKKLKDWVGYYSTFYDAFNTDARQLFWNQINEHLYSKGFDAWWLDATEPDMHSNFSIEERKLMMNPTALGTGAEYFNAYSLVQSRGIYEGQMKENPDKRPFILTRSAFAGQQRFAAATWSGDVASRWSDLEDQIAAGINFSLSGIPYWTTDIGGFSVERRYEKQDPQHIAEWRELNLRWFQFGTFCPLFRIHGQFPYREIFNIAPETHPVYKSMIYYNKLRYLMMPYIYSLAAKTYHDDYTIMRGLVMDYAQDQKVNNITDQFMFGPSLMVNPVTEFHAVKRNIYLPSTNGWYDIYTGKYYNGGQSIESDAPLSTIPVFAPEGSILLMGPDIQYTMEKMNDPLTIFVYTGKDGQFDLYEDEGINNNYMQGRYTVIPLIYNESQKALVIGERKGEYNGMLNERTIHVVFISKEKETGIDNLEKIDQTVIYNGKIQTIEMK